MNLENFTLNSDLSSNFNLYALATTTFPDQILTHELRTSTNQAVKTLGEL